MTWGPWEGLSELQAKLMVPIEVVANKKVVSAPRRWAE